MEISDRGLRPQDEARAHAQQGPQSAGDCKNWNMILPTAALHYTPALNHREGMEELRNVPIRRRILEGNSLTEDRARAR